ncbi:zinc finger protein 546 [Nilaparvata lugens]|uniref:zinc finger protein 546 n=1 Tax=Nilaparvata lugens TaxID=108931 RepID=UPI00193E12C3|nr:zinc finger protein 546 [Nilaparvata lugens]
MSSKDNESTKSVKKKMSISDIKNQVASMLGAIAELDSNEQSEAYDYLQKCVINMEVDDSLPPSDSGCIETEDCNSISNDSGYLDNNKDTFARYICSKCGLIFAMAEELLKHSTQHKEPFISCFTCRKTFCSADVFDIHKELKVCTKATSNRPVKWTCTICDRNFSNPQHYSLHMKGHERNECTICGAQLNSRKLLEKHMMEVHNTKAEKIFLKCLFCDMKFVQKRSRLNHYRTFHKEESELFVLYAVLPSIRKKITSAIFDTRQGQKCEIKQMSTYFRCLFCDMKFVQKRSRLNHYRTFHKEESELICFICGTAFNTKENLDNHSKTHTVQTFKCELCNATFCRRQQYLTHVKDHNKYLCVTCGKSYPNLKVLEPHEQDGHIIEGLQTQYNCLECHRGFHFHSSLFYHMKTHENEKTFFCQECCSIFKNKFDYRQHINSVEAHVKDLVPSNVFECTYCNKTFTVRRKLHSHQFKCKIKKTVVLSCDQCDYKTSLKYKLKDHMNTHLNNKRFVCEKCGNVFGSRNQLTEHLNYIHSDERNFSCEKCGQTFKAVNVLNRHMACHSNEKNHKCHCGQAYKLKSNLRRHQLQAHGSATPKLVKKMMAAGQSLANIGKKQQKRKAKDSAEVLVDNNVTETVYNLLDSQYLTEPNMMLPNDNQMLQVSYPGMGYVPENKAQHLVYSQSLDIDNLHVVETMLQTEESLKNGGGVLVDAGHSVMFDRQLTEHEAAAFHLTASDVIHPPIETSLVTSLGDPLHHTDADHLVSSTAQQSLINALPDYLPHNFPFLNM